MLRSSGLAVALTVLIVACADDSVRAQLEDLGASEDYVDCLVAELESRGMDLEDMVIDPGPDDDPSPTAVLVAIDLCGDVGAPALSNGSQSSPLTGNGVQPADGAYGSDPKLDQIHDACASGDGGACDDLYFQSPIDSEYERFGLLCGDRFPDPPGSCAEALGTGDETEDEADDSAGSSES